jgi:hypothetical protein
MVLVRRGGCEGVWCRVHGVWCRVYGVGCRVHGVPLSIRPSARLISSSIGGSSNGSADDASTADDIKTLGDDTCDSSRECLSPL